MRSTEHFKRHMSVVTRIDGQETSQTVIEDPFHVTQVVVRWNLKDWLKMLFTRPRQVKVLVKIESDQVAHARWFEGADVCETCQRIKIGQPHDGSSAADPGYHHGEERLCHDCYYGVQPLKIKSLEMKPVLDHICGLAVLAGVLALLLIGLPIVAAVMGVD